MRDFRVISRGGARSDSSTRVARERCRDSPIPRIRAPCAQVPGPDPSQARRTPICLRHARAPSPHIGWQGRRSPDRSSVHKAQTAISDWCRSARGQLCQGRRGKFRRRQACFDAAPSSLARVDDRLARFAFGNRDPQSCGVRDHPVHCLSGQRIDTQITVAQCAVSFPMCAFSFWSCSSRPRIQLVRSMRSARAREGFVARTFIVHKGSCACKWLCAFCRSAVQSGQSNSGMEEISRRV